MNNNLCIKCKGKGLFRSSICSRCHGKGNDPWTTAMKNKLESDIQIFANNIIDNPSIHNATMIEECNECNGDGGYKGNCGFCGGSGWIKNINK